MICTYTIDMIFKKQGNDKYKIQDNGNLQGRGRKLRQKRNVQRYW